MLVSGFYAAFAVLIYIYISVQVIKERRKSKIAYGSGENTDLARAVAAHGNFAAYAPMAFILLFSLEFQFTFLQFAWGIYLIHLIGLFFVLGRILHFQGIYYGEKNNNFKGRVRGMILTFSTLAVAALANLIACLLGYLK